MRKLGNKGTVVPTTDDQPVGQVAESVSEHEMQVKKNVISAEGIWAGCHR